MDRPERWPMMTSGKAAALRRTLLVAALAAGLCACAPGGAPTVEPPVPLSNVTPGMLNPDLTFKRNGLVPVDPSEQM